MRELTACSEQLQRQLVESLSPQRIAIAPDLAQVHGVLRGTAVAMSTQRYRGPGFQSLTIACIAESHGDPTPAIDTPADDASTLTVVGLPWPASGLPVLGMDLIALRGSLSLVAIDLAPTDPDTWQGHAAPILTRLREQVADVVVPRRLPAFTEGVFSPLSLIVAARPGTEPTLFAAIRQFVDDVAALWHRRCQASPIALPTTQTEPAITRWLAAERQNRKEHNALSQIFGEPFAQRYLHSFLFAAPPAASAEWSPP